MKYCRLDLRQMLNRFQGEKHDRIKKGFSLLVKIQKDYNTWYKARLKALTYLGFDVFYEGI